MTGNVLCFMGVLKIQLLDPLQNYLIKYNPGTSGMLLTNGLKLLATANYDYFSMILPNVVSNIVDDITNQNVFLQ